MVEKMSNFLTKKGYTVITSNDGIDTMIKAIKELPFLALLDVALPKIYGFELCKRLKERPETKDIKSHSDLFNLRQDQIQERAQFPAWS